MMEDTNEGQKEPEASLLSGPEVVQEAAAAPAVSPEELVDSAPEIRSGPEVTDPHVPADAASEVIEDAAPPSVPDAREDTVAEVLAKAATPEQTLADSPVETTEPAGDKAAEDALAEAAPEPAEAAPEAPAAPSEAAAELCAPVDSTEELVDSAPVVAEAAGEELQMEAPAEPSEEAAAAPPEPEEPFDNSTYKNQQHHSYTPYTFADLDLEMAKFRLPQPSSGRPSPQH
ncbi:uncharacterized protein ndufv3 isoform X1 [Brachyistius frenatus]|uniref:uncharacterized protein ndufv3 isoform X1 n=1 Tax=Brachyistius frenatus TaxID=100188 RepID=UPI0037E97D13